MKIGKKFGGFVYFILPFINGLKKFHFFHFKLMITLLITCLIIKICFGSLVNDTFSNMKLNDFIIIFITICSNKYLKQVVLINHSWISPTVQRGWELEFFLFSKKCRRVHFSPKKGDVGKIVEEGC